MDVIHFILFFVIAVLIVLVIFLGAILASIEDVKVLIEKIGKEKIECHTSDRSS